MEKKCCAIDVTEMEDGFRIEIKGENLKEKCREGMANCCTKEGVQGLIKSLCSCGTGKAHCC